MELLLSMSLGGAAVSAVLGSQGMPGWAQE